MIDIKNVLGYVEIKDFTKIRCYVGKYMIAFYDDMELQNIINLCTNKQLCLFRVVTDIIPDDTYEYAVFVRQASCFDLINYGS